MGDAAEAGYRLSSG